MRNSSLVNRYQFVAEDGGELFGTSHYLLGDRDLSDLLQTVDDSGSAMLLNSYNVVNPSLLVEGERFAQMLETLGEQFRYVFVDVPPLDLVSDAEKIGSMCDGAILVVRSGVTSKRLVKNSISQLERSGCPLLGIVLNRVESSGPNYYYRYGRRYYGNKYYSSKYYGKHGTEQKEQVP
jgi:capsular exopolysaccharide synthesis family protein